MHEALKFPELLVPTGADATAIRELQKFARTLRTDMKSQAYANAFNNSTPPAMAADRQHQKDANDNNLSRASKISHSRLHGSSGSHSRPNVVIKTTDTIEADITHAKRDNLKPSGVVRTGRIVENKAKQHANPKLPRVSMGPITRGTKQCSDIPEFIEGRSRINAQ
ncbi:MAG: hypothetical protein JSS49_29890 [Planctomycetes bacterium]|nr:hypothetical protein [Planctomycetota bacterium]